MAIIIYVILLVNSNWVAVPVCFLMCFPVVYTNLLGGLEAVSDELLEVAAVYELDGGQRLRLLYIPALLTPVILLGGIYGGAVTLEAEGYLSDRIALLIRLRERFVWGGASGRCHFQYGAGVKYIF